MRAVVSPEDIIEFWYADETRKLWFKSTAKFDREVCIMLECLNQKYENFDSMSYMLINVIMPDHVNLAI